MVTSVCIRKSCHLVRKFLPPEGRYLDWGCGTGSVIREVGGVGYEPFMTERIEGLEIYSTLDSLRPTEFDLISSFEVFEHLEDSEIEFFLTFAETSLKPTGIILLSMPIEIGPALLAKEMRRLAGRYPKKLEYPILEFFLAVFLGRAGSRASNFKMSHAGFDFRTIIRSFSRRGFRLLSKSFSPIPMPTWYGNSQIFCVFSKPQKNFLTTNSSQS
jgi:SAM-dependent methyltransferase